MKKLQFTLKKSYIDFDEPPVNRKCLNIIVRRVFPTFLLDENEESDEIENDAASATVVRLLK